MNLKRSIIILATLLVIGLIGYYFSDIVAYILISWVLSMIGQPIMRFLTGIRIKNFKIGRTLSAVITLCVFILGFTVLGLIFVPLIVEQANNLSTVQYESIFSTLQEPLQSIRDKLASWKLVPEGELKFDGFRDSIGNYFKPAMLGNFVSSIVGVASNLLISIFSILFITFFFLKESNLFNTIILTLVPNKYETETKGVIRDISHMLRKYFGGILLQMTIITAMVSLALYFLGVQNALLIGFFAALINVVPYVGPLMGATFGAFIVVSSNLDAEFYSVLLPLLTKVALVFALMQMIDNFLLQPIIYSKSVQAHPLEIFIIILVAAKLGGVVGMILAIPFYTILRVIAAAFLSQFKIVQKLTQGMSADEEE